ncbi:MAG: hypothetical protein Q7R47_02530, partial [Candidatus Diapherotrites archaeon]|nr:hypothetical protein [Candidatus Diapherotrites archaeon]
MNSRGVFLTLMVFMMVISVLVIFQSNAQTREARNESLVEQTVLDSVNDQFEQTYFELVQLGKTGSEKRVQVRGLPFDYDLNDHVLQIRSTIPLRKDRLNSFYDYTNSYAVFLKTKVLEARRSLDTTLDLTPSKLDGPWTSPSKFPMVQYVIAPQCAVYKINDLNTDPAGINYFAVWSANASHGCPNDFNAADLNALIVHVSLPVSLDPTSTPHIGCTGDLQKGNKPGNNCHNDEFKPKSANPYVAVYIDAPGYSTLIAAGHIDPLNQLSSVSFVYTRVESDPKIRSVGTSFFTLAAGNVPGKIVNVTSLENGAPSKATVSVLFDFKSPVKNFYLWGVDLNVQKEGFDLKRYS